MKAFPLMIAGESKANQVMCFIDVRTWEQTSRIHLFKERTELVAMVREHNLMIVLDKSDAKYPSLRLIKYNID